MRGGEPARRSGGEVLNLAVLWALSPEEADDEGGLAGNPTPYST
jgi:hypothetical protein